MACGTVILRCVVHSQVSEYEAKGWTVVSKFEGSHHAQYAVIMQAPSEQSFLDLKRYAAPSN